MKKSDLTYFMKQSDYFWQNQEQYNQLKENGMELIFQYKHMIVLHRPYSQQYFVWNLKKLWSDKETGEEGHIHIYYNPKKDKKKMSKSICINICKNMARDIVPPIKAEWLYERYYRLADSEWYRGRLKDSYDRLKHKDKREKYHNVNKHGICRR